MRVGAGGLGSCSFYILAAGIRANWKLTLIERWKATGKKTNLFETKDIGQSKTTHAKGKTFSSGTPDNIETVMNRILKRRWFSSPTIWLLTEQIILNKIPDKWRWVKYNKPWILWAIQGFDGQVVVFLMLRRGLVTDAYIPQTKTHITNCAESGVIGAVAGINRSYTSITSHFK